MSRQLDCPKCKQIMEQLSYKGVVIDKCPSCEGVWLDKGEEDFVVEVLRMAENESCETCVHFDKRKCKLLGIVVSRSFHCANHSLYASK